MQYLVSGVGLEESVQLVHLSDVGPQVDKVGRDLEVAEEGAWKRIRMSECLVILSSKNSCHVSTD